MAQLLTLLSLLNAFFTFWRRRHYRLFENSIDAAPGTPSARRVRVDSSPNSSSPFRYFASMLTKSETAESRAYPVFLSALLTAQLAFLESFFSQQSKDNGVIQKQVLNEYDNKYVHPTIYRSVRSVGTQCTTTDTPTSGREVLTFTPTTYVNRGFETHPNPNYSSHYDPDGFGRTGGLQFNMSRSVSTPSINSPLAGPTTKARTTLSSSAFRIYARIRGSDQPYRRSFYGFVDLHWIGV